jgi:alpha-tubulin suppressor-like RCC1 family protein
MTPIQRERAPGDTVPITRRCWPGEVSVVTRRPRALLTLTAVAATAALTILPAAWGDASQGGRVLKPHNPLSGATQVAAGGDHTCALLSTGHVVCWGKGTHGQLGNNALASHNLPVPVVGINNATQVSAGTGHTCAVLATHKVKCWGLATSGQLGNGAFTGNACLGFACQKTPIFVVGLNNAASISAGGNHTCAVTTTSHVVCWGQGTDGQLGNNAIVNRNVPVFAFGINNARQVLNNAPGISAGKDHTCVIVGGAVHVKCWGLATSGQLGNGAYTGNACGAFACQKTPLQIPGLSVKQMSAGGDHTCMWTGLPIRIGCWGLNNDGQLGQGGAPNVPPKTDVVPAVGASQLGNWRSVSAGGEFSCAAKNTTQAYCWGFGSSGQNGVPGFGTTTAATNVVFAGVRQISAGDGDPVGADHACVVKQGGMGTVYCWGSDQFGQLGDGNTGVAFNTAVPVEVQ